MRFQIHDAKQFTAGILFAVIGLLALFEATSYTRGTITAMGPGYLPVVFSVCLIGLGLVSCFRALSLNASMTSLDRVRIGPVLAVAVSAIAFGLLIESFGLVAAVVAATAISSYAQIRKKPLEVMAMACGLAAFTSFLFVYVLKLPLKLF